MSILGAFAVPHPPLIIPQVGRGREKEIQKTIDAFEKAMRQAAELKPDTVVVVSPHATMYADYLHISPGADARGDFSNFGVPSVVVSARYDEPLAKAIEEHAQVRQLAVGFLGERDPALDHGTTIPLYFLKKYDTQFKVVRMGVSGLSAGMHYAVGQCVKKAAEELSRRVILIASGDLSHRLAHDGPYGFSEEGPKFDAQIQTAFKTGDFLSLMQMPEEFCESAGECGLRSFWVMAGALDGFEVEPRLLSYEGPFGVGYAVATFFPKKEDGARELLPLWERQKKERLLAQKENEDAYVHLARRSLEHYIKTGMYVEMDEEKDGLPKELLQERAGVFVSLKKDGRLRGCIGTIQPTQKNIAQEIIKNAVSAATADYRFDPVLPDELPELSYSVDVLGKPEPIKNIEQLDVARYGVIVERGSKRGLLLPDLAGVDTPEEQIKIALQKAGIGESEPYQMQRFEVIRHT